MFWCIRRNTFHIFCETFIWDCSIPPAVLCLGTLSGTVGLVCEWVISCPWMKSSVVNERRGLNSPSHRWREETKRNGTITRLRGNKCLFLRKRYLLCATRWTVYQLFFFYLQWKHTGSLTVKLLHEIEEATYEKVVFVYMNRTRTCSRAEIWFHIRVRGRRSLSPRVCVVLQYCMYCVSSCQWALQ